MNPGLTYLMRHRHVMLWRSLRRRFSGVKGALALIFLTGFMVILIVSQIFASIVAARGDDVAERLADVRTFGPVAMLAMMIMMLLTGAATRGGVYFKPAEIAFLFPAPIGRRQLLLYNILGRFQIQALSSVWITVFVARMAASWVHALLGCLLSLAFLEVTIQSLGLLTAAVGQRLKSSLRWAGVGLAVLFAGTAVWSVRSGLPAGGGLREVLRAVAEAPVVRALSLPFVPFVNTFAAAGPEEVALWGGISLLMVAVTVRIMFSLDVAFEEASLEFSRRVQQKVQRMRGGGGAWAVLASKEARSSLPRLPRMRGAEALCWRQLLEMKRNMKGLLVMTAMVVAWPAIMAFVIAQKESGLAPGEADIESGFLVLMVIIFSAAMTQNLSFDFRRDLPRMPYLKTLPLSPMAVAAGQIASGAVLLGFVQFLGVGGLLVAFGMLDPYLVVFLLPPLVLVAWSIVATDNALFLLMPYSVAPEDAGQVGFMGRLMIVMSLKFLVLGVVACVVGMAALLALFLTGWRAAGPPGAAGLVAAGLTGALVLAVADVLLTWATARAFAAFDPSRDTPE